MINIQKAVDETIAAIERKAYPLSVSKYGAEFDAARFEYLRERQHFHCRLAFLDDCLRAGAITTTEIPDRRGAAFPSLGPAAPRRIMQFWESAALDPDIEYLIERTRKMNRGWFHHRFNLATARNFVRNHFGPQIVNVIDNAPHIASKADIFRLCWIYQRGGLYLDADEQCVSPFNVFMPNGADFVCSYSPGPPPCINNCLIMAPPQSPVVLRALAIAVISVERAKAQGFDSNAWLLTGPGTLTMAFLDDIAVNGRFTLSRGLGLMRDSAYRAYVHNVHDMEYKRTAAGNWRM